MRRSLAAVGLVTLLAACGKGDGGGAASGDPYAEVTAAIARATTPAELDQANGACIRLVARAGGALARDPFADATLARRCGLDIMKARVELWFARGVDCVFDVASAESERDRLREKGHPALAAELEPALVRLHAACADR